MATSGTNQRVKQISVIVATAGVIFVNYLAGTGYINNTTPGDVSDRYPTLITPAGYAFAIWSLIYLGLAAFSIYQALPRNAARFVALRTLYIFSCVLNCLWIYLWHYDRIPASLAVIFLLLGTLVLINLNALHTESKTDFWLVRVPFNIYFGWVTAASIINSTIALLHLGATVSAETAKILACVLIVAAVALGVTMRFRFNNAAYPLAIAWAITAIAVKQSLQTPIVVCAAFGVAALLLAALYGLIQKPKQIQ